MHVRKIEIQIDGPIAVNPKILDYIDCHLNEFIFSVPCRKSAEHIKKTFAQVSSCKFRLSGFRSLKVKVALRDPVVQLTAGKVDLFLDVQGTPFPTCMYLGRKKLPGFFLETRQENPFYQPDIRLRGLYRFLLDLSADPFWHKYRNLYWAADQEFRIRNPHNNTELILNTRNAASSLSRLEKYLSGKEEPFRDLTLDMRFKNTLIIRKISGEDAIG